MTRAPPFANIILIDSKLRSRAAVTHIFGGAYQQQYFILPSRLWISGPRNVISIEIYEPAIEGFTPKRSLQPLHFRPGS